MLVFVTIFKIPGLSDLSSDDLLPALRSRTSPGSLIRDLSDIYPPQPVASIIKNSCRLFKIFDLHTFLSLISEGQKTCAISPSSRIVLTFLHLVTQACGSGAIGFILYNKKKHSQPHHQSIKSTQIQPLPLLVFQTKFCYHLYKYRRR